MNLKILNNTKYDLSKEKQGLIEFFKSHSIGYTVSEQAVNFKTSTFTYKTGQGYNRITGEPQTIKFLKLNDSIKADCVPLANNANVVMFVWEIGDAQPDEVYTNWTDQQPIVNDTIFIQIVINKYLQDTGEVAHAFTHENMHFLCYYLNARGFSVLDEMDKDHLGRDFYNDSQPNNPDSNFGETFKNIKPYLSKLSAPTTKYKYFSPTEVARYKMRPEVFEMLDKVRGLAGIPFILTSGLRTSAQSIALGGTGSDAHTRGLAADISCTNSTDRLLIINAALQTGLKRIGDGLNHIHLDIDPSLAQNVMWIEEQAGS